ncbi:hypothetical protein BLNAU_17203 [Blattamonas nauphoetae]|uniref:Uncharacterized protein n=1 Tax=Blattamonas nauphoetae TaxID=2049346 RepID=A0ABQ9X7U3_9EUKA|nr:hypothetical protein BLNAU_17203 [Blattamonas nauphoetae]
MIIGTLATLQHSLPSSSAMSNPDALHQSTHSLCSPHNYVLIHHQDGIPRTFLVGVVPNVCDEAKTARGIVVDA